jgi:ornithine lipid hydroxylase
MTAELIVPKQDVFRTAISWISWPALFVICMTITGYGFSIGQPILFFNVSYIFLIIALYMLEVYMPHEDLWRESDGQFWQDLGHTLSSKGTVQLIVMFSGLIGLTEFIRPLSEPASYGIWPRHWPMAVQATMGIIIAEFPLYWAHRLGHKWPYMWRFHQVHHSVTKLWIVNTGRFHFMDSLIKIVGSMAILMALGAPMEVIHWLMAVTAFIGMMTHCNVEMRFGWLSWWFNTPELHRWHHSKDLREGNKNYCENIMLWDHLFGTYFRESWRRPPATIGIKEFMPPKFSHQIIWPFISKARKRKVRERLYPESLKR